MGILNETSRSVIESDMVGKTVKYINHSAVNVLYIQFTDDSFIELWADSDRYGVPVIELDPNAEAKT
jgi:hypothetical protein